MGLLNRIFKPGESREDPPSGTQFQDSDAESDGGQGETAAQRTAVRRELVQVTLRETMRRHAVPSDWLEVRMLPVVTRKGKSGMHVQLVVKQGQGSLLTYIPSFQSALMAEIEKFEPRAWDWLLSISWQFAGISAKSAGELPAAAVPPAAAVAPAVAAAPSVAAVPAAPVSGTPAPVAAEDELAEDLQALFAIRDAALKAPPPAAPTSDEDFEPTRPGAEGNSVR